MNFKLSTNNLFFILNLFYCNFQLIKSLAYREIIGRYKGSILGLFWSFANPLFMLGIYTFVFSFVFRARWGSGDESRVQFALILFAGLILFNFFSECISRAPGTIISNTNYVKKVIFPIEIFSLVNAMSALFHFFVSLIVWSIFSIYFLKISFLNIITIPIILIPFILFVIGLSWFISAVGVYFRDLSQIIGILITALLFLSPIFYPITLIPEKYQIFIYLNPLTFPIETFRGLLFDGHFPELNFYLIYLFFSLFVFYCGFFIFKNLKKGFSDVL